MTDMIERRRHGREFRYVQGGRAVSRDTMRRISSLAVPPAWRHVRIAVSNRSKVQATGVDAKGRRQYIYSDTYRRKQEAEKFTRITQFAEKLPKLRRQVEKDLNRRTFDKRKVLACAVALMDREYFRVGNPMYARENGSYGLTTLRSKHVNVRGRTIIFDFIGKSGQHHYREITDEKMARLMRKLDDMPGYELFRYYDGEGKLRNLTSDDVNHYIKGVMGDEYSAKDFRTWGGTLLAAAELARLARPASAAARQKVIRTCIKQVAKKLGNTPAIARSSYIDPRVLQAFEAQDGLAGVYDTVRRMKPKKYLAPEERLVIELLRHYP